MGVCVCVGGWVGVGVKVLLTADVKPTHTAYALGAPFKQGVRY